jgi:RimJ/RimL family protein N-acetyltransferase
VTAAGFAPVRIADAGVTLRPFTEEEVSEEERRVYEGADPEAERFEYPMGRPPRAAFRERLLNSGRFVNGRLDLAVEADGKVVGAIQARQPKECTPPGVFSLGIALRSEHRGRGLGREAVRLITGHLFTQQSAHRVELSTDVENGPMRRVAERLGFVFEGVLRSFFLTEKGPRDYALYALTKGDWGAWGGSSPAGDSTASRDSEHTRSEQETRRTTWT